MINSVENTDIIDKYLRNELNDIEKQEFERLLSAPSESLYGISLNEEMELQKEIILAIKARGLKECLQKKEEDLKLEKEIVLAIRERGLRESLQREEENIRKSRKKKRTILIWSGSVASTLIAASLAFMIVLAPIANLMKEESILYATHIKSNIIYQNGVSIRGSESLLEEAKYAISKSNWSNAEDILEDMYKDYFKNKIDDIYPNYINTPYAKDVSIYCDYLWLKALCEMHNKHIFKAKYLLKKLIQTKNNPYYDNAKNILKKIEK